MKRNTNYIKNDLSSFIADSSINIQQPNKSSENSTYLSSFPLNTDKELFTIEQKLSSEDLAYANNLVRITICFLIYSKLKTCFNN